MDGIQVNSGTGSLLAVRRQAELVRHTHVRRDRRLVVFWSREQPAIRERFLPAPGSVSEQRTVNSGPSRASLPRRGAGFLGGHGMRPVHAGVLSSSGSQPAQPY